MTSKKRRTDSGASARERLRDQRAREAEAERRKENMLRVGVGLGIAIVVIAVFGLVQWQRSQVDSGAPVPAAATGMGQGVAYGQEDAPVRVELFEDFLCSHCRDFTAAAEPMLDRYLESGDIRVLYHPVTLDAFGEPTERAANAYACAAEQGEGAAREYQHALFENYGTEWTDPLLIELGTGLGLEDSFQSCVEGDDFAEYVRSIDQAFTERGATGTPTIYVNGGAGLDIPSAAALRQAIEAELGNRNGASR